MQGKGNNLRCTMFQAQGLIYRTYRGTTFRAFLQTSLRHQKQARQHFHESHNLNNDLKVTILQNNIKTAAARRYDEYKLICTLKTLAQHGSKTETGDYAKEMYNFH